jgi:hypothetical protein
MGRGGGVRRRSYFEMERASGAVAAMREGVAEERREAAESLRTSRRFMGKV